MSGRKREGVNDNPASGDKNGRGGLADFLGDVIVRKTGHWKAADDGLFRDMDNACFPKSTSFYNDETYHWWVVCVGREPVAYAALAVQSTRKGKPYRVKFTRCGVLPDYRGHGFQRRLLAARLRWCARAGAKVVQTYTHKDNKHSQANLLAHGFKRRTKGEWVYFRKEIP